jgi:hypothetical protein
LNGRATISAVFGQFGLGLVMMLGGLKAFADDADVSNLPPAMVTQIDFSRDIKPILEDSCLRCHGPDKPRSHFRLDNREAALKGGDNGVDILSGNSAKSPLIQYVAYQVEDMEMPPVGRGKKLTPEQIALLRAWIDQGTVWEKVAVTNDVHGFVSFTLGGTSVSGDSHKYQELNWQKAGLAGGGDFQLYQQATPDTLWVLNGHILPGDYEIDLNVDQNEFGFVHSGFRQYRKYYDDTGGYEPSLISPAPALGENLYLDIGKAWVDVGLTRPDWPQIVLGYEYDYRRGNEASTEWGSIGTSTATARNISPSSENINEGVNIIKFNIKDDIEGVSVVDDFRGEFYRLTTGTSNTIFSLTPQIVNNGTTYFEGANTLRLEKKFSDWFFGSAGYLFSKLNSDDTFSMDEPSALATVSLPKITLERESNVGNLNGLLGPFDGLVISSGIQAEWDHEDGAGGGSQVLEIPPPPFTDVITPFVVSSSYGDVSLQENVSLRYSKIPYTGVYAEAKTEQEDLDQYDQFSAPVPNLLNKAVFYQHTSFASQQYDVRTGFDTSPWQTVSFGADYHFYEDYSTYDGAPLVQPIVTAYPTFLLSRELITDEAEAKLVLQPTAQFKTTLSYRYQITDYGLDTRSYPGVSPGGQLTAADEYSHIFSINTTLTPITRLFLSTLVSYEYSSLRSFANNSPTVEPYAGHIITVLADATFVAGEKTDLFAGYFFSEANYRQNNFAAGLPLGIVYQQHNVQVGLTHRFNQDISARLQYRYSLYDEPSNGGATNFHANSFFGMLTWRF